MKSKQFFFTGSKSEIANITEG